MQASHDLIQAAKKIKLRYIPDNYPGLKRLKNGKNFKYIDVFGKDLKDSQILERINKLAIPPAWKEVWISPLPNSHLQATGQDEKGRKQYIYHQDWTKLSQQNKFNKLIDFALKLPKIRRRIDLDLNTFGLAPKKVLATIVWLLENTFIRVGNEEYARENNSFGLTTLRNKHVSIFGSKVRFEFKGKSGIKHLVNISHPKVSKVIKKCIELPGFELFQCIDSDGKRYAVNSEDVNEYLQDIAKDDITAKEFRTWGGTTLSAQTLHNLGIYNNNYHLKKNLNKAFKTVAHHLRNTTAVCKNYYIHPKVIESYQSNILVPHFERVYRKGSKISDFNTGEYATLTLLQRN